MQAPDIAVGEVRAVRFVEVVVALEEAAAGGDDDGGEEGPRAREGGETGAGGEDLAEEAVEEADLFAT